MAVLFYLTFFFFSLGQLGRISLFNNQINFYFYEIFLFIIILYFLVKHRLEPIKQIWKKNRIFLIFFATLFLSLVNGFWNYSIFANLVGFLYWSRLILYGAYALCMIYEIKQNPQFKKVLNRGISIIVIITILTTITQYFLYPDLRNLLYLGWDPHLQRTFGVFFDTSIAASIYGLIFLFSQDIFIKTFYLIFLILSFTRSAYFALIISVIYLSLNSRFTKIIIFVLIFVTLIFLAPKPTGEGAKLTRTFTIMSRIKDNEVGFRLFLKKPFLGYGYNRLKYVRGIPSSNAGSAFSSSYLTMLVSSGIMGLISLMGLMRFLWKKQKKSRALLIFLGIVSLFDNVIFHPFVIFLVINLLFDRSQLKS